MCPEQVMRGPAARGVVSPRLFTALRDHYGIRADEGAQDLGGSSNLNLLLPADPQPYVVRVYRPAVTVARLADIQRVRQSLADSGVPCARPLPTRTGELWIRLEDRLVEVEPYVEHDAKMDSWLRLTTGLPLLGRIHTLLRTLGVSADGRHPPAANYLAPSDVLPSTLRGTHCIRQWLANPGDLQLAVAAEELAQLVEQAQHEMAALPPQLVHGDYWDNNVLFQAGHIVLVADLDFMGERARIDDLALTLYYTNSTFSDDPTSEARIRTLRGLTAAYDAGVDEPLTLVERAALPVVLARTPLAFIAMIPAVDSEAGARRLAAEMRPDIAWALAIMQDLKRWQRGFA